jgi:antitoxin ParD1/3/4
MAHAEKPSFNRPAEPGGLIDAQAAPGSSASATEAVPACLGALDEHDAAVERWLREAVAPVVDAMRADPERAQGLDDVLDGLRARHARAR